MKNYYFVYNPHSGSAPPLAELQQACKNAKLSITKFVPVDDVMRRTLNHPIKDGATIIVLGGDGTMNTFANLLVGTKAVMAPLSGGTFNHFTRGLAVPANLDQALKNIAKARVERIDTVSVNGTYFVNNSILGLYPQSLQIRSTLEHKYGKWPAAVVAVARTLLRFHTYYISVDGRSYRTPYVFIGNNNFGLEELGLPGRKRFDGGEMSMYVAHASTRWRIIKLTVMAAFRRLQDAEDFVVVPVAKEFTIKTKRKKLRVSHDGELSHMTTPLRYKMHPKSLRIVR